MKNGNGCYQAATYSTAELHLHCYSQHVYICEVKTCLTIGELKMHAMQVGRTAQAGWKGCVASLYRPLQADLAAAPKAAVEAGEAVESASPGNPQYGAERSVMGSMCLGEQAG